MDVPSKQVAHRWTIAYMSSAMDHWTTVTFRSAVNIT